MAYRGDDFGKDPAIDVLGDVRISLSARIEGVELRSEEISSRDCVSLPPGGLEGLPLDGSVSVGGTKGQSVIVTRLCEDFVSLFLSLPSDSAVVWESELRSMVEVTRWERSVKAVVLDTSEEPDLDLLPVPSVDKIVLAQVGEDSWCVLLPEVRLRLVLTGLEVVWSRSPLVFVPWPTRHVMGNKGAYSGLQHRYCFRMGLNLATCSCF